MSKLVLTAVFLKFGPPHEHKGPEDFSGKRDDDDEEDETDRKSVV